MGSALEEGARECHSFGEMPIKKHGENTNHKKTDTTNKTNGKSNSTFGEMKEKKGNIYHFERITANQKRRSNWKGQARKE